MPLSDEQRTPLVRAAQCLAFMQSMRGAGRIRHRGRRGFT
jgi:hypothetical protein